jgi:hypothetical protein
MSWQECWCLLQAAILSSKVHLDRFEKVNFALCLFKAILLLKVNHTSEWDVHSVGKALGQISGAPGFGAGGPTTSYR